jgi:circadian clock protein KaiC
MVLLKRLPTGIANLDRILGGGFLLGGAYIIQGPPGAGKTILANQIASHHIREGGKVVYLTLLSECHDRMMTHLGTMEFFEPESVTEKLLYVSGYAELEQEGLEGIARLVRKEAERHQAKLLVVDGLFVLEKMARSEHAFRLIVHELQASAHLGGYTLLLLTNAPRDTGSPEYTMVDGWVELADVCSERRVLRELEVHKFRGSNIVRGRHRYRISSSGLEIYPRLEAVASRQPPTELGARLISSGIPELDDMMGGGIGVASTTLLVGPSGTGKTIASLQFAAASTPDEPGLFLGFYESPTRLQRKALGVGIDLEALRESEALHVHWFSPTEILVDQVADWFLREIDRTGARRLVVDGIAGFQQNLVWDNRMGRFLTALGNELRSLEVTALYTSAMTGEGQSAAPGSQGVAELSPLVDNLISMQLAERGEALQKQLRIMKVPDRDVDQRLITYTIGPGGIALAI